MLIRIFSVYIFLQAFLIYETSACTIFYVYKDGVILAGSNEDWKDPYTKMWFYPAEGDKQGWVKFGFGGGFPQAGMNESGLFWDATSGPYLGMPYSEEHKIFYDGALMQKVIEECSDISEALEVFEQYYCQDQYKAQYLLGDSSGHSIIVEGDDILYNEYSYQVLTNFYQSCPELGGYPCWRYDKAVEMLQGCENLTEYFAGTVLASTHQEGNYPTQYSIIFNLKARELLLFYYHNYHEFLSINLDEELDKGANSYNIPPLFLKIKLISPSNGDMISGASVTLQWKGLPANSYEVLFSEDPGFDDHKTYIAGSTSGVDHEKSVTPILLLSILIPGIFILRRRKILPSLLLICTFMLTSCNKADEESIVDNTVLFTKVISGLEPNTTYYWKISAAAENSANFRTETITYSFMTQN